MRARCLVLRIINSCHLLALSVRIVRYDKLNRVKHSAYTCCLLVEVVAYSCLKQSDIIKCIELGISDRADEVADALRRVTTAAHTTECRHSRVVPSTDKMLVDKCVELALRHHCIGKVQTVELNLAWTIVVKAVLCRAIHLLQIIDELVVKRTVRNKLQCAD